MNRSIISGKGAWNKSFTLLKLLFLLASCTTDLDGASGTPGANDPVPLLVKNITLEESAVATRAATAPAVGSSIGVFRQTDSYYTTASNNIKYTLSTDKGWQPATADTDILLGSNDSRALLYAYHPAGDKIAVKADNVTIDLAARAYDADYDLSYVPAGQAQALDVGGLVYNFHPGVNFTMRRAYTQLGVDLTRGDDYGGAGAVTAVSLTVNGGGKLYSGGTQNIATGAYTAGTADINKITYTVPADTKITPAAKTASFRHLLPPGKSGAISDLTLTATVDGMTTRTTISAAGLDLKAGTRYVVKATFNYNGLAATIKTTDWDSQTAWKEDVTFVPIVPPGPIDIGLDFVFAPGNLIATSDGLGGYTYAFAEWQGYYSGDVTKGDYFSWNTLEPNKRYNPQLTENPDPLRDWDDTLDPCRQMDGGEWYTPTYAQAQAMAAAGSVWGAYTKDGVDINGLYIGTSSLSTAQAAQDDYVFLPAVGGAEAQDAVFGAGNSGGYRINGDCPYMYFNPYSNGLEPWGGIDYSMYSVRCVKNKPVEPIDIGLDFLIAPGNVIAISNGKGGYTYKFAEEQGYYTGGTNKAPLDPSGGDYFAWNTLDPAATTSSSTTKVWDDNNDVCRKIEDGQWYTPTQAQLQALVAAGSVWGKEIYTMKDGIKVNGGYLGTKKAPTTIADQDKYVFLPAGGNRMSGSWSEYDTHGYYWSSTPGMNSGFTLIYSVYGQNVTTSYNFNDGQSVRCVRNK